MNYWIITDTHLGHNKLVDEGYRPKDFEISILNNLLKQIKPTDVLICLGDVCIGSDAYWHNRIMQHWVGNKCWLVKGNHDNKSNSWYLNAGWDCVSESLTLNIYGKDILFSHCPVTKHDNFDLNIHGHLHNTLHHEIEGLAAKHKLLFIEHTYAPVSLRKFIGA